MKHYPDVNWKCKCHTMTEYNNKPFSLHTSEYQILYNRRKRNARFLAFRESVNSKGLFTLRKSEQKSTFSL